MHKKVSCILLIDDNADDNFFHERIIRKAGVADIVIAKRSGEEALEYLKSSLAVSHDHPDLIFLDINMPGMNGWDFLKEYSQLEEVFKCKAIVLMLSTSTNPDEIAKTKLFSNIMGFNTKPLTQEMVIEVVEKYLSR